MMNRSEPVLEAWAVQPSYVDSLAAIIPLGPVTHLLFAVRQPSSSAEIIERTLQVRLIVPTDQLKAIGLAILAGRMDIVPATDANGEPVTAH
jgi:hypothetical protein